ncbi:hypothetical protein [Hyalangium versicolor]|uniref:hypothetical protein n=1 Tax=Hyalangium versicolor TaxID=2861190 RepID=UPI001CCFC289|nr:hypothetical protein [Hyalangium versicolor]
MEEASATARLREYRQTSAQAFDTQQSRLRDVIDDTTRTSTDRETAALQLFAQHLTAQSWWGLLRDAEHILQLPPAQQLSATVREQALLQLATTRWRLHQRQEALQLTERFLREFPSSVYYTSMEVQANRLLLELREIEQARSSAPSELAAAQARMEEEMRKGPLVPAESRYWVRKRCERLVEHFLLEESLPVCHAIIESWQKDPNVEVRQEVVFAWRAKVTALAELGRFAEARANVEQFDAFVSSHPDLSDTHAQVTALRSGLPLDEPESSAPR